MNKVVRNNRYIELDDNALDYLVKVEQEKFILQARADRFEHKLNLAEELIKEEGCYDKETKTFCDDVNYDVLPKLLEILEREEK